MFVNLKFSGVGWGIVIRFFLLLLKTFFMRIKILFIVMLIGLQVSAQQINLKSFQWNLSSDSVSVNNVDPSDVYLALLSKGIIDRPFFRDNEKKLQWIGKKEWTFETNFTIDKNILIHDKVELVFEGVDTYASVYLNGAKILEADNMFRSWIVDVKGVLKEHNHIKVVFDSPFKVIESAKKAGVWKLPYDYGYVRKAPYHFGWDWGPTFVTCGIWRPVYIRAWNNAKLKDVYAEQKFVDKKKAEVSISITMEAVKKEKGAFLLFRDDELIKRKKVNLQPGENRFQMADEVANPELWWPNGLGEPHLYHYKVLFSSGGKMVDSMEVQTGFRTIEVVQQPDSIGKSFYFKVNGVPVFAKGANYIPPDNFLPRVTNKKYRQIITDAKKANMNMIRVWGGGTYEKDIFYRLCDENGIMVWQDFMFACNMNPGDTAFMANVKQEAIENVIRLRNHPSLVLWCGNNEVDEAWHNWGWQKSNHYSDEDSIRLWHAYTSLFEEMLPEVVRHYAPQTFYWPSSPSIGWGHAEAFQQGDVHYWEVWWGKAPFVNYEKKIGRFMSEYGFQGMPDMKTINAFTLPEDRYLGSHILNAHQKHPFGWEAIGEYMKRNYPEPVNLGDYDYVSQLLQAKGIGMAIEAHRRAKPRCMGTLYWQLNDCWPVVSWSSFDYYGRWKALHYTVKKVYAPLMVSFDETVDSIRIWVVSDEPASRNAVLKWRLMNFQGALLKSGSSKVLVKGNSAGVVAALNKNILSGYDTASVFIHAELLSGDAVMTDKNYYFVVPKAFKLLKPDISVVLRKAKQGYLITLTTDKPVVGLMLSANAEGFFSDNYFDLLPGKNKQVIFETHEPLNIDDIRIKTLFDIR